MLQIPMKPSDVTWTDEQWKAIWAKGCDILVSAAAGSGKTAVLIERLIQKILASGDDHVGVDQLLVATFTNASAAEMRNRLAEALEKEIARDPQNVVLRSQLSLLSKAQISTLHSFCLTVCREFAYRIDLDPGFRLASPDETALLQDDVLIDVLEKAYAGKFDTFKQEEMYRLVDSFSTDRSDQQIEKLLQQLYETSRVQPNPYEWLESLPKQYALADDIVIDDLELTKVLKATIRTSLLEAQAQLKRGLDFVTTYEALAKNVDLFTAELNLVDGLLHQLKHATWQDMYELIHMATFGRISAPGKKVDDVESKNAYAVAKAGRDIAKDIIVSLQGSFFARKPALFVEEMRNTYPVIETLIKLTIVFSEAYKKLKLERSLVDFSDLEHYALEILKMPGSNASAPIPSDVALNFKERFKEVLVDEYQDSATRC